MSKRFEEWYAAREWWRDNKDNLHTHWQLLVDANVNEDIIETVFDFIVCIMSDEYGD